MMRRGWRGVHGGQTYMVPRRVLRRRALHPGHPRSRPCGGKVPLCAAGHVVAAPAAKPALQLFTIVRKFIKSAFQLLTCTTLPVVCSCRRAVLRGAEGPAQLSLWTLLPRLLPSPPARLRPLYGPARLVQLII